MAPSSSSNGAFDPFGTFVHLPDGPEARPVPVTADFWQTIDRRTDLHAGRMVTANRFASAADWPHWERHPAGDEIVCLLSGELDLVIEQDGRERVVELRGRSACIVPRGTWHRGVVRGPSEALFITRGEGTEHRPYAAEDRR